MQVKLTSQEVVEACREWLERHYGIKAGENGCLSAVASFHMAPEENKVVKEIQVTFAEVAKPAGGPYRT